TLRRYPGAQLLFERANLLGGLREFGAKAVGLPDLKLVAETREGHGVGNSGMRLERLAQRHPALGVELEHLARAVERGRELLAFVRIRCKARDQGFDLRQKRVTTSIERWPAKRRITVDALVPIAGQHSPKRCRNRHPALGVETQRVMRHEPVHGAPCAPPPAPPSGGQPQPGAPAQRRVPRRPQMGCYGLSWDCLGVNGDGQLAAASSNAD